MPVTPLPLFSDMFSFILTICLPPEVSASCRLGLCHRSLPWQRASRAIRAKRNLACLLAGDPLGMFCEHKRDTQKPGGLDSKAQGPFPLTHACSLWKLPTKAQPSIRRSSLFWMRSEWEKGLFWWEGCEILGLEIWRLNILEPFGKNAFKSFLKHQLPQEIVN